VSTPVLVAAADAAAKHLRAALVTIVRANGSTPQRVGAKMLVYEDGRTVGTIGGGCYENDACLKAREALREGRPQLVRYDLNDDLAAESGLICGGQMDVFIEPIVPAASLFVIGAGHVGYHTARLGALVGFSVTVVDDRAKFANAERFPDASEVVVDEIPTWLAEHPLPNGAYAVVVTRGHRQDLEALRPLLSQPLRYIGLIGSRAKIARLYDALVEEGVGADRLAAVHAPIGLDIGAVTPEEIAIAIVAELVAVKYGKLTGDGPSAGAVRSLRWSPAGLGVTTPNQS
jgi:xanthine dehydrogenase accessory factor